MQLVLVMRDLEPGLMPAWDLTGIQSGHEVSGPAWPGHKQGSEVQVHHVPARSQLRGYR